MHRRIQGTRKGNELARPWLRPAAVLPWGGGAMAVHLILRHERWRDGGDGAAREG